MTHTVTQIATIKALIDTLADLDITPLHLHVEAKKVGDQRPHFRMWTQTRTDFERLCAHLKIKATERRYPGPDSREWFAEKDTDGERLLIQCVSFAHQDDWQPRVKASETEDLLGLIEP